MCETKKTGGIRDLRTDALLKLLEIKSVLLLMHLPIVVHTDIQNSWLSYRTRIRKSYDGFQPSLMVMDSFALDEIVFSIASLAEKFGFGDNGIVCFTHCFRPGIGRRFLS